MAGILDSYGYHLTQDKEEADLWFAQTEENLHVVSFQTWWILIISHMRRLINSCTVKDPSQAAFVHLVKKAQVQQWSLSSSRIYCVVFCVSVWNSHRRGKNAYSFLCHTSTNAAKTRHIQTNTVLIMPPRQLPFAEAGQASRGVWLRATGRTLIPFPFLALQSLTNYVHYRALNQSNKSQTIDKPASQPIN